MAVVIADATRSQVDPPSTMLAASIKTMQHAQCPSAQCRQQQGAPNSSRDQGAGQHIALAVARGLHWLHTHGIVHGDIRPSKGFAHNDKELAVHCGMPLYQAVHPVNIPSAACHPCEITFEPLGL